MQHIEHSLKNSHISPVKTINLDRIFNEGVTDESHWRLSLNEDTVLDSCVCSAAIRLTG